MILLIKNDPKALKALKARNNNRARARYKRRRKIFLPRHDTALPLRGTPAPLPINVSLRSISSAALGYVLRSN
jgi:hypothetical protein